MTVDLPDTGPTSRVFFSQRLRMHYVDWGNPEAPPLILLHGGRDHCRNWDWVAADLRRDWHVICPDLRGHGDSAWSASGHYTMANYIYDLAQLIHQQDLAPVTIVAHSLGGNIALRYAGIYPENVRRIVAIEGLGPGPRQNALPETLTMPDRMRRWIDQTRALSGRMPRRYPTLDAAYARMQDANKHLSAAQARHLTQHGVNQNEDGTYSWKFDHYVRLWPPYDRSREAIAELWGAIACPTLLVWGRESWASNPETDGRAAYFRDARVLAVDRAGHWVHHDQLELFLRETRRFLGVR
ncbi:MAG TPA: alpha/beta hydrolase [Rhodopila sp.]|uniref:alpha/beta fold hydrolase n=1 Tax=Rhodopila sp. TaxID=2480087 RepID=UPI002C6784D5|nr:alpha/beta hydrolase [Rhodopila sp.]HVY14318.1 alpha/beta hydrolase [Rhodopila sp.]